MSYRVGPTPTATLAQTGSLTVASTTTEYAIPYNLQVNMFGISNTLYDSKIYVKEHGYYLITISAMCDISQVPAATLDIYTKVNGTVVDYSNTQVAIPNATTTQTLAVNFIAHMNAGDYFEFFYHGSTDKVRLVTVAAATTPTRPVAPSVIVTINKVGV